MRDIVDENNQIIIICSVLVLIEPDLILEVLIWVIQEITHFLGIFGYSWSYLISVILRKRFVKRAEIVFKVAIIQIHHKLLLRIAPLQFDDVALYFVSEEI